jgi:hypothetical protein
MGHEADRGIGIIVTTIARDVEIDLTAEVEGTTLIAVGHREDVREVSSGRCWRMMTLRIRSSEQLLLK